ncbi:NAD-dependent deacetylase [Pseudomonas sp. NFR02]|nr:NAD-dependent deacetylase [Pseudomonas sp. NFR02]
MEPGRPGPNHLLPRHSDSRKRCCVSYLRGDLQNGRAGPPQEEDITGVVLEKASRKPSAESLRVDPQICRSSDVRPPLPKAQVASKTPIRLTSHSSFRETLQMSNFERAVEALSNAREAVVFTGAGISVESGIPTYSDPLTGIWARQDPETLETARAFRENPRLIWGWYLWRRYQASIASPNAAHLALSQLSGSGRKISVITQNVDDLHERAGSVGVLHLHGKLSTPKCFACHRPAEIPPPPAIFPADGALIEPPRCGRCNGKLRPGVVWYGEDLPLGIWKSAIALVKNCDVLISVGTSGIVTPAAEIPKLALSSGATVIQINTADVSTGMQNEVMLIGKATDVLPKLCALIPRKVSN